MKSLLYRLAASASTLLVLASSDVRAGGTQAARVQADILLLPSGKEPANLVPSDIKVSVEKRDYLVESIRPANDIKKVVVFDLGAVAAQDVDCFVAQMEESINRLRKSGVEFLVISRDESSNWFDYGDHGYQIFETPPPGSCSVAHSQRHEANHVPRQGLDRIQSLGQVIKALWPRQGPIQLVWVTENFLVGPGSSFNYHTDSDADIVVPNVTSVWMEYITRLGLTLFPVIWERENQDTKIRINDAAYAGGEAVACRVNLAPCLERVFHRASGGWIMHVTGPPVREQAWGIPALMQAWYRRDLSTPILRRPFAVPADPAQKIEGASLIGIRRLVLSDQLLDTPTVPLFSDAMVAKLGCPQDKDSLAGNRAITLLVPRHIVEEGGGHLKLYTSVLEAPSGATRNREREGLKMRTTVDVTIDASGKGQAEACIVLPPASKLPAVFGIVLFDERLYWAGTVRVEQNTP